MAHIDQKAKIYKILLLRVMRKKEKPGIFNGNLDKLLSNLF